MIEHAAVVLMGPLLYAQGRWVRRSTPLLPEPCGPREGHSGQGQTLRLLIAGDSAAAGVGVAQQGDALSGQLVDALAPHAAVSWRLLANSGDDSAKLLTALQKAPAAAIDVAVISIGVNDVTAMTSMRRWRRNLHTLVEVLQGDYAARRIVLSSLPPMHLFPALPHPLRWWLGLRARRLNQAMASFAESVAGVRFVPIPYAADTRLMASDGFHPGAPAYRLWAAALAAVILQRDGVCGSCTG